MGEAEGRARSHGDVSKKPEDTPGGRWEELANHSGHEFHRHPIPPTSSPTLARHRSHTSHGSQGPSDRELHRDSQLLAERRTARDRERPRPRAPLCSRGPGAARQGWAGKGGRVFLSPWLLL